jgi:hypothetical protein
MTWVTCMFLQQAVTLGEELPGGPVFLVWGGNLGKEFREVW